MFGLKKKKGTIEKISEECRKYFNNDKEIEEENSDEEIEVENFYEKIEVESFDKEIETENDISLKVGVAIDINVNYERGNIEIIIPKKFLYDKYL